MVFNRNMMSGHSVDEMIAEYKRGKAEMETVLKTPGFVSSTAFCSGNSTADKLFEKTYFAVCKAQYYAAKSSYVSLESQPKVSPALNN